MKNLYISRTDHLAARMLAGEMMIMSAADFRPHVLNETASFIWQAADGVTPLHEIANNVCEEFDVAPDVALDDATTLVRDMVSHGVLLLSDQPAVITAKPQAEKPNVHADAGQPRQMKPFYWGIEEELLLCCARASMDPGEGGAHVEPAPGEDRVGHPHGSS